MIVLAERNNALIRPRFRPSTVMRIAAIGLHQLLTSALAANLALHTMGMVNMFGWKTKLNAQTLRMIETTGAYDGGLGPATHGLLAGTRIATAMGWRAVNAIAVGDLVLTFDNGLQAVTAVRRSTLWVDAIRVPEHMWSVHIPAGALGNYDDMTVLPEQGLLIESDAAMDKYGDPFAVVPAASLAGVRGITRQAPRQAIEIVTLSFDNDQVVYAEGNVMTFCPAAHISLNDMLAQKTSAYDVLNMNDASFLAECIVVEGNYVGTAQAA